MPHEQVVEFEVSLCDVQVRTHTLSPGSKWHSRTHIYTHKHHTQREPSCPAVNPSTTILHIAVFHD